MVRTGTGFAILIALALLMAAGTILRLTWASPHLTDAQWLRQVSAATVVAELGVACLWWPMVRRGERPMRPSRAMLVRMAGGTYVVGLVTLGILAGMSAASGVLIVPCVGGIVLLVRRPRLATMWLLAGVAGPGLAVLVVFLLDAAGLLRHGSDWIVGMMLFLSSFPFGMLLGLALAAEFVLPAASRES